MKAAGVCTLLLIALSLLLSLISSFHYTLSCEDCLSNTLFYMFGESTCPHCNRLHQFFQQNFPSNSYYFCVIDKYEECYKKFGEFVLETTRYSAVPQTLVVKKGANSSSILALVIGAVIDKDFWLKLACSQPSAEIPVYAGSQLALVIPVNTTDHSYLINKYLVYPEKANNQEMGIATPITIAVVAILVIAIGGYIVYSRLKK